MSLSPPPFPDLPAAHRFFAAHCFNRTWEYFDQPVRTAEDNEQMILCALASLWHWTQRDDAGPQQFSVGYWQVSRAYALAGQADNARRYAEKSLEHSHTLPPFYRGCAHEALARAAAISTPSREEETTRHLTAARTLLDQIADPGERDLLAADLGSITATG